MKKGILLLLLMSSVFTQAQSLKEALFSGKLKNEPGTVIRKGDDLSTKIDTTTRKVTTEETAKTKTVSPAVDSTAKAPVIPSDSAVLISKDNKDNVAVGSDTAAVAGETANAPKENTAVPSAAPKNNNVLWKEYVDSATSTLKTEVLTSKKIKRGMYYATVSYTIGTDGQVEVTDVFLSPENSYLQQQIKDRLNSEAPRLAPALSSTGAPRKVSRKYNFTLTKE